MKHHIIFSAAAGERFKDTRFYPSYETQALEKINPEAKFRIKQDSKTGAVLYKATK